jgi:peptidyl-prolyl cis-trans isomerase B (cyclophilin B)
VPTNKQRREAARRHLERQLERRVQREQSHKRVALISSVVGTLVVIGLVVGLVVGLGGSSGSGTKQPAAAGATPTPTPTDTNVLTSPDGAKYGDCTFTKSGKAVKPVAVPKDGKVPTKGTVQVKVATNRGDLTFALNRTAAPCTVYSFVSLVKQGFYNKTPCHRLVTSGIFVLQCGDPTGTGTGGPGYTIPDEALDRHRLLSDVTRVLSDERVSILSANVATSRDRVATSRFTFEMAEAKHLGHLLRAIRGVEGVYDVYRVHSAS